MNFSLHHNLYWLHEELAPFRRSGVELTGEQVAAICRLLALCAAEAEQLSIMLGRETPVLIDPTDDKIVCIARYRRGRAPNPNGGGSAA